MINTQPYALPIHFDNGTILEFYYMPEGVAEAYLWDDENLDSAALFLIRNRAEALALVSHLRGRRA